MSARNATVAIESATKSVFAKSCDKKEGKIKSPEIKKTFSSKISGSGKMFLPRLKFEGDSRERVQTKGYFLRL